MPRGAKWDYLLFCNRRADHPVFRLLFVDPQPQSEPRELDPSLGHYAVFAGGSSGAKGEKLVSDDLF